MFTEKAFDPGQFREKSPGRRYRLTTVCRWTKIVNKKNKKEVIKSCSE